ncbi:hypothetical protein [Lentilactobacillus kisonensis]|uniref:hypothetical protein n=1 Tax=Lentilactobacillus kisonensis TaxID=481722 RepID=UPI000A99B5CD|nr:hypothetical protein [Lentilactobacillus kisonensis]
MKLSSVIKVSGVGLLSALVLAGCGSNSSQSGSKKQTANWMVAANINTMDPSKMTDLISSQNLNGTNEGLLRMAKNNTVVPGVAKKITRFPRMVRRGRLICAILNGVTVSL